MIYIFLSNKPSSGDINSSDLSCLFKNKLPNFPEYAKMQFHTMTLLEVLGKIEWIRQG